MQAAVIEKPGSIRIETRDDLGRPAPDEVNVRVMASGICGTDVHIYRGEYLGEYPIVPGHEFSGVVEAIGERVTRVKIGDRVAIEPNISCDNCAACRSNRQNFCENWQAVGVTRPGGMAQLRERTPKRSSSTLGISPSIEPPSWNPSPVSFMGSRMSVSSSATEWL